MKDDNIDRMNPFVPINPSAQSENENKNTPAKQNPQAVANTDCPVLQQDFGFAAPLVMGTQIRQNISNAVGDDDISTTIFADNPKNCLRERTNNNSFSYSTLQTHDNLSFFVSNAVDNQHTESHSSTRTLTNGIAEVEGAVLQKENASDEGEFLVKLKIIDVQRNEKHIEIPVDMLKHDAKALKEILIDNGVILKVQGCIGRIQAFLLEGLAKFNENYEVRYNGYYTDNGNIRHIAEDDILRNAADSSEILEIFRLTDAQNQPAPFINMMLLGIGCIASVRSLLTQQGYTQFPLVVLSPSNAEKAVIELIRIFCDNNKPIRLRKGFEDELKVNYTNNPLLTIPDNSNSPYMNKKLISRMHDFTSEYAGGDRSVNTFPLLVTSDPTIVSESIPEEHFVVFPYVMTGIDNRALKVFNWFRGMCIRNPQFLASVIENAKSYKENHLEPNGCPDHLQELFALLLAMAYIVLKCTGNDPKENQKIIWSYYEYLTNTADNMDNLAMDIIKDYLNGAGKHCLIPQYNLCKKDVYRNCIGYNDKEVMLSPPAMQSLAAANNMSQTELAKQLKAAGALDCSDKYQKNIRVSDGTSRLYAIPLDSLYDIGQVRIQPDEFEAKAPALMVKLGICDGNQIYYALNDLIGTDSPHILVTGPSGSGKSYFLRKFAKAAAEQGVTVISFGTDSACLEFDEGEHIILTTQDFDETIITFRTVLEPLQIYDDWTEDEIELIGILANEQATFDSVEQCIEVCKSLYSNELDGMRILARIETNFCFGVYNSGFNWQKLCKPGALTTVVSSENDTVFLNTVLKSFFDYKCSMSEVTPCLLIMDECQELDLHQNAPLVKLLLRQGRKYGIIAVLATQYLTADNGKNIDKAIKQCETIIAFKPGDDVDLVKLLKYHVKDERARKAISNIGRYFCITKGWLATDRCRIDYPLILNIPE